MLSSLVEAALVAALAIAGSEDHPFLSRPIDPTHIAVKSAAGASLKHVAGAFGNSTKQIQSAGVSTWYVVEVPSHTVEEVARMIHRSAGAEPGPIEFVSPVMIAEDGSPIIPTRDLLFRCDDAVAEAAAIELAGKGGAVAHVEHDWLGMPGVTCVSLATRDGIDVVKAVERIAAVPGVRWAEPDCIFSGRGEAGAFPNDPSFTLCWGLHNFGQTGGVVDVDMDALEAWDITTGSGAIAVAIIDVGVQPTHADINQIPGTDVTNDPAAAGGAPVNSCDNHGTAVAGCVSGVLNNMYGGAEVAPGCKVVSIRTMISKPACDGSWNSVSSMTVAALDWALTHGVRVTCNSNYYSFTSQAIADKYAQTRDAGMVHFASAGNSRGNVLKYPASLPSVNSVTAIKDNGELASFASKGPGLDFAAPGVDILTTDRTGSDGFTGGDFVLVDGTSFSAPYAAGVAALVLSLRPEFSAADVETLMQQTADDYGAVGYDTNFGFGVVNARQAVIAAATVGDLNGDGVVDGADLGLLLAAWDSGDPASDLNHDGVVDGADLGLLLSGWS